MTCVSSVGAEVVGLRPRKDRVRSRLFRLIQVGGVAPQGTLSSAGDRMIGIHIHRSV
jgi:hypothetical protein